MACGSFDLDVPRRNLRSFSRVSGEKEYNRDSADYIYISLLLASGDAVAGR